jgi:crotonobetainyl-CoA:carnitine CoA-transferase CaiB-like acyl-CoA transferase
MTAAESSPDAATGAPLEGIKVVDLSRVLAGPYCAQLMADMGATVIKVEAPDGDECRRWPPFFDGDDVSTNFGSVNRGKLGMTVDFKSAAAPEVLSSLVRWADVVVHNFLPGTAARLGVDYERLRAINPRIVYLSLSGYGERGPLADKPGYDLMMQAFSGAMGLTGYPGQGPVRIGVSFIDMATGIAAYGAVVTALLARERTGRGTWVRLSLLETAVAILGHHGANWFQAGMLSPPLGSAAGNLSPYQAFACTDGYLVAGATNDRVFARLCKTLGCPEAILDARFSTNALRVANRDALNEILFPRFATASVAQWAERLEAAGVPASPVNSVDQVMEHPQVEANDMIVEVDRSDGTVARFVGTPFKIAGHDGPSRRAAPHRGADAARILGDVLGFAPADVERLMRTGA